MEKKLTKELLLLCGKNNIIAFDVNVGKVRLENGRYFNTGLPKGFSDLLLFTNDGRVFFFEVKVKPNKLSKEQVDFIQIMRKRNFFADALFSVNDLKHHIKTDFSCFLYYF